MQGWGMAVKNGGVRELGAQGKEREEWDEDAAEGHACEEGGQGGVRTGRSGTRMRGRGHPRTCL